MTFDVPIRFEPFEEDYAPFARFGDGGLLLHTGRFHACAGGCPRDASGNEGPWRVTIDAGDAAILHDGARHRGRAAWNDGDAGAIVYIGAWSDAAGAPNAIVDPTLPDVVRDPLDALPALLDFYAQRLGAPGARPLLLVSYDPSPRADGRFGTKGGVLQRVVYMNVYGAGWRDEKKSALLREALPWFFAHEAAHLFQEAERGRDPAHWWIHEGGAEAFAWLAVRALYPASDAMRDRRVAEASKTCAEGLARGPLATAHTRGQTSLHYACGLVAQLALAAALEARGAGDLFALWRGYLARVRRGEAWSAATFLREARDRGLDAEASRIEALLETPLTRPRDAVDALLEAVRR